MWELYTWLKQNIDAEGAEKVSKRVKSSGADGHLAVASNGLGPMAYLLHGLLTNGLDSPERPLGFSWQAEAREMRGGVWGGSMLTASL